MYSKSIVRSSTGLAYELDTTYLRSVIMQQVAGIYTKDTDLDPFGGEVYSYSLDAQVGREALSVVKEIIKKSSGVNVSWTCEKVMVCNCQWDAHSITVINLKRLLKAKTFSFYPLHVTLLKVSESTRRSHTTAGRTVRAYLPTEYRRKDERTLETSGAIEIESKHRKNVSRAEILQTLHGSFNLISYPRIKSRV